MQLRPAGPHAVLVEVEDPAEALSLALWARGRALPVEEIVPAARTVLFDGVADPGALRARLDGWEPGAELPRGPVVEVPVVYDGPDLDWVAARWGATPEEVVARHTSTELVSAFCGFAPGFAYLAGLPEALAVPRLETPRTRVAPGSVGLAGSWCGIYPTASPGGWRLIGRTEVALWDPRRDPPALLAPGTRVRFREVAP